MSTRVMCLESSTVISHLASINFFSKDFLKLLPIETCQSYAKVHLCTICVSLGIASLVSIPGTWCNANRQLARS